MFSWWRKRRRRRITAQPFPEAWRSIIGSHVAHAAFLTDEERARLEGMVQVFLAEKNLEGCGGLTLTDEIRVTVAANACLLLIGLDHQMYRRVHSVLIYPSTVMRPERRIHFFERPTKPIEASSPLAGEAHQGGPVILVWDAAKHGSRNPRSGHNVIFHEFAHKLDMLDGLVDGTPPMRNRADVKQWAGVCSRAYLTLQAHHERGEPTFMDSYGTISEAEFFAVATETFFERPDTLLRDQPDLYAVLRNFYRQDPAARMAKARRG